jgi:zinc transport system ATP-binding protein
MGDWLLRATALQAGYDGPVVGPLSFTVGPREVVGLWGPNRSGTSTVLRAVMGTARVLGGTLERAPGLTLGYQAQHPVRLDEMPFTGAEYLRYAAADRESPPDRLTPWLGGRLDRLSGGQFQLLSVWAALGGRAGLVLLDEPTNNLDPGGEALLAEVLGSERGRRATLLVSHERDFLAACCSRVVEVGP